MKTIRTLLLLLLAAGTYSGASAKIYTVNNNQNLPANPGQYTDVQSAITAASSGDTILIAGSPNSYSGFNITKKLVIIGPGYNPDKQNPLVATINSSISFTSISASNSVIMGLFLSGISNKQGIILSNIIIRRNHFIGDIDFQYDSSYNTLITENIFESYGVALYNAHPAKFVIENNIFENSIILAGYSISNTPPIYIDHNLFMAGNSSNPQLSTGMQNAIYSRNAVISNNIFYNMFPMDTSSYSLKNYYKDNTFNNNLTYSGITFPTLPYGSNIGSGNIDNTDPLLTTVFTNKSNYTLDLNLDDLRLQSSSPAKNAATDKTDIGPTGGDYPIYVAGNRYLTGEPTIPEIKEVNYIGPSSVSPGQSIKIQVKATRIN